MAPTDQQFDIEGTHGTRYTVLRVPAADVPDNATLLTDEGFAVTADPNGTYRVDGSPETYRRVLGPAHTVAGDND